MPFPKLPGKSNTKPIADALQKLRKDCLDKNMQPSHCRQGIEKFFDEPARRLSADKVIKFIIKYFNDVQISEDLTAQEFFSQSLTQAALVRGLQLKSPFDEVLLHYLAGLCGKSCVLPDPIAQQEQRELERLAQQEREREQREQEQRELERLAQQERERRERERRERERREQEQRERERREQEQREQEQRERLAQQEREREQQEQLDRQKRELEQQALEFDQQLKERMAAFQKRLSDVQEIGDRQQCKDQMEILLVMHQLTSEIEVLQAQLKQKQDRKEQARQLAPMLEQLERQKHRLLQGLTQQQQHSASVRRGAASVHTEPSIVALARTKLPPSPETLDMLKKEGYSQKTIDYLFGQEMDRESLDGFMEALVECVAKGQKSIKQAEGKSLTVLLGGTGSGKSTTINYLLGHPLVAGTNKIGKATVKLDSNVDAQKRIAAIGHDLQESMTLVPACYASSRGAIYCDLPGFHDTRSKILDLANVINRHMLLQAAASVKIIVLVDYDGLTTQRGLFVASLKNLVRKLLGSQSDVIKQYQAAIVVGVNRIPLDHNPSYNEVIRSEYFSCDPLNPFLPENVVFINPLSNKEELTALLGKLEALPAITDKGIFRIPLDSEDFITCYECSRIIVQNIERIVAASTLSVEEEARIVKYLQFFQGCLNAAEHEDLRKMLAQIVVAIEKYIERILIGAHTYVDAGQYDQALSECNKTRLFIRKLSLLVPSLNRWEDAIQGAEAYCKEQEIQRAQEALNQSREALKEYFEQRSPQDMNLNRYILRVSIDTLEKFLQHLRGYSDATWSQQVENVVKGLEKLELLLDGEVENEQKVILQLLTRMQSQAKGQEAEYINLKNLEFSERFRAARTTLKNNLEELIASSPDQRSRVLRYVDNPKSLNSPEGLNPFVKLQKTLAEISAVRYEVTAFSQHISERNARLQLDSGALSLADLFADVAREIKKQQGQEEALKRSEEAAQRSKESAQRAAEQLKREEALRIAEWKKQEEERRASEQRRQKEALFVAEQRRQEEERRARAITLTAEVNSDLQKNNMVGLSAKLLSIHRLDSNQLKTVVLADIANGLQQKIYTLYDEKKFEGAKATFELLGVLLQEIERFSQQTRFNYVGLVTYAEVARSLGEKMAETIRLAQECISAAFSSLFQRERASLQMQEINDFYSMYDSFSSLYSLEADLGNIKGIYDRKIAEALPLSSQDGRRMGRLYSQAADVAQDVDVNVLTYRIVALSFLVSLIPARVGDFRQPLYLRLNRYLDRLDNNVKECMMHALMRYQEDIQFSPRVEEILKECPAFRRAKIKLFNKKASARSSEVVFKELKLPPNAYSNLQRVYDTYDTVYKEQIESVISNVKKKNKDEAVIVNVDEAWAIARRKPVNKGALLAYIFCAWSTLDIYCGDFDGDRYSFLQPHPTQVLSILLMLGDHLGMTNRFLEIKTGEGKSVVNAVAAIALTLQGYEVDVGCYSDYLAQRDKVLYHELMSAFSVAGAITYAKFSSLLEKRLPDRSDDLRKSQLAAALLKGWVASQTDFVSPVHNKRVLIVDEVDVFFGEDFLGEVYRVFDNLSSSEFSEFIRDIWENRGRYRGDTDFSLYAHPLIAKMQVTYPYLRGKILEKLIDRHVRALHSVERENYHCDYTNEGEIGCYDKLSGDWHSYALFGEIAFFYLKTLPNYPAWPKGKAFTLCLCVGVIAYIELLNQYDSLLGVTATLSSLTEFQKRFMESRGINFNIKIPSPFKKKTLPSEPEIHVLEGYDNDDATGYFYQIKESIQRTIRAGRAVLVVFENLERLEAYQAFIQRYPYSISELKPIQVLTEKTLIPVRDRMIANAATQGQITYLTKIFGRGSDFICRDPVVRKAGGVHVLQTFFSEDITEQVQIQGRTCRQDDLGSYEMIVWRRDLSSSFNLFSAEYLPPNPYKFLSDKRDQLAKTRDEKLESKMEKAKEKDWETVSFFKLAQSSMRADRDEALRLFASFQS